MTNEIRVGLNRQTLGLTQEDNGQNLSSQFGIPGINVSPQTSGLSNLNVAGLFDVGGSLLTPLRLAITDWNFSEKVIWTKGRHSLRFGFDSQYELGSTGYLVYGRGYDTFLNFTTSTLVGTPGGNAYASFLLGAPYQVLRDDFPAGMEELLMPRNGMFVQDDFKVSRRLTLNLGARYDIMPYAREKYNRLSNFDPATRIHADSGTKHGHAAPRSTDYKEHRAARGYRLRPRAATTRQCFLRLSYGNRSFYRSWWGRAGILNSTEFNVPFYYVSNITEFPFTAPTHLLSSPPPALVDAVRDQRRQAISATWSPRTGISTRRPGVCAASSARLKPHTYMLEVAYVGTSGVRLLDTANINAAPPGATDPTTRQPYRSRPRSTVEEIANSGHSSSYNGLQSKIEQRFSHRLSFLASYTWSKSYGQPEQRHR